MLSMNKILNESNVYQHGVIVFTDPDFNGERIRSDDYDGHSDSSARLSPNVRQCQNQDRDVL